MLLHWRCLAMVIMWSLNLFGHFNFELLPTFLAITLDFLQGRSFIARPVVVTQDDAIQITVHRCYTRGSSWIRYYDPCDRTCFRNTAWFIMWFLFISHNFTFDTWKQLLQPRVFQVIFPSCLLKLVTLKESFKIFPTFTGCGNFL
jgi:hypothetical protein